MDKTKVSVYVEDVNELIIKVKELEKENERLKAFIAYHKLDGLYDLLNSPEIEEQWQEFLRIHKQKSS
jgi:hypothetical protein